MGAVAVGLDQWRISDGWFDVTGGWHEVPAEVRARLRATIDQKLRAEDQEPPPPVWIVTRGEQQQLQGPCDVQLEDGTWVDDSDTAGGVVLPPDLPLGAHRLVPRDHGATTHLFVTPPRQELPRRCWGWTVQLYGARSHDSWGQGDLVDLADLARWAARHGAGLLSHNPLGDTLPLASQEPSPYFTSSRKFPSLLYLRVEAVPGAAEVLGGRLDELARAGRALNERRTIDRDEVYRLKVTALREVWQRISPTSSGRRAVDRLWGDSELLDHATFNSLAHRFGGGWDRWDRMYTHPRSRSVESYRNTQAEDVEFWLWVQGLLAEQHGAAATAGAALMNDLPVGFMANGSDAWIDQDCLALDWRIGAPGDEFNPAGQNWGIVPYLPQKLRALAYRPWLSTLRRLLRNTAALRMDHIMGLFRLFLIPEDPELVGGAYLYQYGSEMLDLALMEAVRAGVTLAGEDLGTVEDEVRAAMAARNIPGYRVGWFEDTPPTQWPPASVGSLSTHDLPTLVGLVDGADAAQRHEAGLTVDSAADAAMLGRLERNFLDGNGPATALAPEALVEAAYRGLAAAGSYAVFASLEDACCEENRPNLPGTVDEHENWRVALPLTIDELDRSAARGITLAMAARALDGSPLRSGNGSESSPQG